MQEFGFYERARGMKRRMFDYINKNIKSSNPFLVDWVLGACMIMPRLIFNKLGGFDESFFLYEEEVDLLYRMKKIGFDTYILPGAKVIHNHNTATSKLGFAFIRYHGFRSVIIYSNKHDRNIKKFFSKSLYLLGYS
jgi:GT2 family glycosyltransferase